jgi:sulfite dehydrogenase (cytochrome) subunit A
VFKDQITSNDNFFIRYHLADIPQINAATWRLSVGGDGVATPFDLGFDELKSGYQPVELVAVCQCSGNRRGLAMPHVAGVEWGIGAMGNARWKGARLRDVLAKAGLKDEAIEIAFDGADGPVLDKTPDFVKSLPVWKAVDPDTIIAYEMNGEPLPHFNGFPARIVAPGWTATYWMKHLAEIEARLKPLDNFWMKGAYRVPARLFPSVQRFLSQETPANTPITEIMVNSLITSPAGGAGAKAGDPVTVAGLAWDAGYGISSVEISTDGGKSWASAELGQDLGRYSFRSWQAGLGRPPRGRLEVLAKATNAIGQSQPMTAIANPAGYHHNAVARLALDLS